MSGLTRRQYLKKKNHNLNEQRAGLRERAESLLHRAQRLRRRLADRHVFTYEQHQQLERLEHSIELDLWTLKRADRTQTLSTVRIQWLDDGLQRTHEQLATLEAFPPLHRKPVRA